MLLYLCYCFSQDALPVQQDAHPGSAARAQSGSQDPEATDLAYEATVEAGVFRCHPERATSAPRVAECISRKAGL